MSPHTEAETQHRVTPALLTGGGGASGLGTGPLKVEVALRPVLCSDIASP